MRRCPPVLVAALSLGSIGASPGPSGLFDDSATARGSFVILDPYYLRRDDPSLHAPSFPVDIFLREWGPTLPGYFQLSFPPWDPANDAGWIYANETGRVRVIADTTNFHPPDLELIWPIRHRYTRWLDTSLHWKKRYVMRAGDTATFTVNRSYLTVFHPHWYDPLPGQPPGDIPPTPRDLPRVKLTLSVWLHRPELPPNLPGKSVEQFWTEIELVRDADAPLIDHQGNIGCALELSVPHHIWHCERGAVRGRFFSLDQSPLTSYLVDSGDSYVLEETAPYTGTIDLTGIRVGEGYEIEYFLAADAASYGVVENWTSGKLGDPLDPESGLSVEVTSVPAAGRASRLCDVEADPARFSDQGGGTIEDTTTGLVWQRCPAGYALDDAGTPGDMADDRCLATGTASRTWQAALQFAASDTQAGHDDWRLPNVKELESIAELGCHMPAIEPAPFPDTPSESFWTSTPGRIGPAAMALSFADGSIHPWEKASSALVRLVRTGPRPPAPSPTGLRVGAPEAVQEDPTATPLLVFPVVLDRPTASDVTVQYQTLDDSARAGEDYVAASGTLVIPAGSVSAEVAVPVLGDSLGEPPESLYLVLDHVSANARLVVASSLGVILDDGPRVEVTESDAYEGDADVSDLPFLVTLSKTSSVDTAVTFATSDGTATSSDYVPASATLTIPAGETSGVVHVSVIGDQDVEGDEYLTLTLTGVSDNAVLGPRASGRGFIVEDDIPLPQALNDTGIGQCTNGSLFLGCPQAGWPGQDAEFGRDVTHSVGSDGYRGFSFTKLDAGGVPLPDQTLPYSSAPWSCVRDEVTGLVWEIKTNDGGLHDIDWTYTWYSSVASGDGGSPGTPGGGVCADAGQCDTEKFVAAVNAAGLCGASDWRLPGREELRSIVVAKDGGFIYVGDPSFFPNTPGSHWTSTPTLDPARARYFVQATPSESPKSTPRPVRLVRGGGTLEAPR